LFPEGKKSNISSYSFYYFLLSTQKQNYIDETLQHTIKNQSTTYLDVEVTSIFKNKKKTLA
jgi:hypothetical protein